MFDKLKHILSHSNKVAGVEIIQISGNITIYAVVLEKKKDSIEIISKHSNILSIEELAKDLPSSIPVCLSISSKSILHKKASKQEKNEQQESKLLQSVIPNAKIADFYVQQYNNENSTFLSIQRRDALNDLLRQFEEHKLFVHSICFGPSSLPSIYGLTPDLPKSDFTVGYHHFTYSGNEIETYQFNTDLKLDSSNIFIGKDAVEPELLVSFSTAFEYFFPNTSKKLSEIELLTKAKEDLQQVRIFKKLGWGMLVLFFSVLLINYFVFDYYNSKHQELEVVAASKQQEINKLQQLKKEISYKKELVQLTGVSSASKSSKYTDDIAKILPADIQLIDLKVYPQQKQSLQNKKIQFETDQILIKGYTVKSTILNKWIKNLKNYDWVNDIDILNYKQSRIKQQGEFEIRLFIDV